MNDDIPSPIGPPPPPKNAPDSCGKKILLAFVVLLFLLAVGAGAYFIGSHPQSPEDTMSTEATFTPTPTVFDEPSITPTSTASGTLTPTKKVTSTSTPTPIIKQKTISATESLDGFRSSNAGGNNSVDIRAGRNSNLVTRGFVSFDLSEVPAGADIQSANLRLYQTDTDGNPYAVGGALKIDHLNYGDSLDNSDYSSAAILSSFATLTTNNVVEWKDADVTSQVKDDIATGRSRSQFRIHFTTEVKGGDVTGDFAYFESAENDEGTGNTPQLVIKYY
jgi:hypothetical protein